MALSPRLDIRQTQGLSLTPQLMQSIRLLQLSHVELSAFVEDELLRNPLLEREVETNVSTSQHEREFVDLSAQEASRDVALDLERIGDQFSSAQDIAQNIDAQVGDVFPERDEGGLGRSAGGSAGSYSSEAIDFEEFVADKPTLRGYLEPQISVIVEGRIDRLIAERLLDCVDGSGYLNADWVEIAPLLGVDEPEVLRILRRMQGCEPTGIFARDLAECLALQLAERNRLDPMMIGFLQNLDLVGERDFAELQKRLSADREDILDMLGEVRALNPKPALGFEVARVEAVVPDVFVREGDDGTWLLELNTEILPKILINRIYYSAVKKGLRDASEKSFMVDCLHNASWLTKSLDQRAQSILKVASEIVRRQDGFLRHGISQLRPMTMKEVAAEIGVHESTVSRVSAQKYMETPRGLLEMKFFFTSGLNSAVGGGDHSSQAVLHRIKQLIASEKPNNILSDDTIAEILRKEDGVEVARRTVAKYRESMNIGSSVARRKAKKGLIA